MRTNNEKHDHGRAVHLNVGSLHARTAITYGKLIPFPVPDLKRRLHCGGGPKPRPHRVEPLTAAVQHEHGERKLPLLRRHGNFSTALILVGYLFLAGAISERLAVATSWGSSLLLMGTVHVLVAVGLFVRARASQRLRARGIRRTRQVFPDLRC